MLPAYLEQLAVLPVLPSGKADRNSLPPPGGERRLAARGDYVAPADGTEQHLAELLASVLHVERVSADSHFFDDLGADSLLMASFNATVRERGDLPAVSMKDVYLHPTIRQLAAALPGMAPLPGRWRRVNGGRRPGTGAGPRRPMPVPGPAGNPRRPGRPGTCCAGSCSCWSSPDTHPSPPCG